MGASAPKPTVNVTVTVEGGEPEATRASTVTAEGGEPEAKRASTVTVEGGEPEAKRARTTSTATTVPGMFELGDDQMKRIAYKKLFDAFDTNKGGSLDFGEFGTACTHRSIELTMHKWKAMSKNRGISKDHFGDSMFDAGHEKGTPEWTELHSKCLPEIKEIALKLKEKVAQALRKEADAKFREFNLGSAGPMSMEQFMEKLDEKGVTTVSFEKTRDLFQKAAGQAVTEINMDHWFNMISDPQAREEFGKHEVLRKEVEKAQAEIMRVVEEQ